MNQMVGERISIATFKAQTTRHRIMGIVNDDDAQIVFSDTPGVLKPNYKLQESMLAFSESALVDADVLLYVTDPLVTIDKNADLGPVPSGNRGACPLRSGNSDCGAAHGKVRCVQDVQVVDLGRACGRHRPFATGRIANRLS